MTSEERDGASGQLRLRKDQLDLFVFALYF